MNLKEIQSLLFFNDEKNIGESKITFLSLKFFHCFFRSRVGQYQPSSELAQILSAKEFRFDFAI